MPTASRRINKIATKDLIQEGLFLRLIACFDTTQASPNE